jgi:hypothetical protein
VRPIKFLLGITFTLALLTQAGAQSLVAQTQAVVQGTVDVSVAATCKDSAGNLYETASSGVSGNSGSCITEKLTPAGAVSWTNTFDVPPNYEFFPYAIASGTSGDVFVFGFLRDDLIYSSSAYLLHISATGTTLWNMATQTSTYPLGLAVDAAGNPIVELQNGLTGFNLIKYNKTTQAAIYNIAETFNLIPQQSLSFINDLYGNSAGYCYAIAQTPNTSSYFVVRFNEVTGAIMWNKPITAYGSLTKNTPAFGTVLSSGDFLVAGAATSTTGASLATLDRFGSAAGAFVYRSSLGIQAANNSTAFTVPPVSDGVNQAYWSISETNYTSFTTAYRLGKTSATGVYDWSAATGSGFSWTLAPSTSGGLFAGWATQTTTNFVELSVAGGVLWTDSAATSAVPGLYGATMSVNASNDLTVAGGRQNPNLDNCFGLLTLNGTNHATLLNSYFLPDGDEDVRFGPADHDTAGNSYFFETRNLQRYVDKVSPAGTVWRTYLGAETIGANPVGICYSSLGYVGVVLNSTTALPIVAKLNASTGALLWETELTYSSPTNYLYPGQIAIDGLGNVDLGSKIEGSNSHGLTATLATQVDQFKAATGAHAWTYSVPLTAGGGSIVVDATSDVYAGGYSTTASALELTKLSDTGALVFSKAFALAINAGSVYYASNLFCDATGNIYVGISDTYNAYATTNPQSAMHVESFTSAGASRWASTLYFNAYYEPETLTFKVNNGFLYFLSVISKKGVGASSAVVKMNATSGAQVWQSFHLSALSPQQGIQEFSVFDFDLYGNPIIAGESIPLVSYIGLYDFVPGQAFVHKIDATTGTLRWDSVSQGTLTSPYNHISALNVFPNNQIWALGQTPCGTGPGSVDGLALHYASAPYCVADSYNCVENTALPSTDVSVLANDQDVTSATCAVVTNPAHAASFSLSTAGKISYTPVTGFVGTDTFTYKATTAYGVSNTVTVTIKIAAP